ncbi:MAG: AMP-dependent synthetase/ligase [Dermabacter sp.]|nr:AMP-dependent synthetase/ligase [Dermabacter sp.]
MKQFDTPMIAIAKDDENATDLLLLRQKKQPDIPIFSRQLTPGVWSPVSVDAFVNEARGLAQGLMNEGVKPGDVVGIMSRTRYEWVLLDWAIWFAGAVSVPIYETSSPGQIEWIASDSGAQYLFVESSGHAQDVEEVRGSLPDLTKVFVIDEGALERLMVPVTEIDDAALEAARTSRVKADVATIIYTSGTTGRPKGAQLTHANFMDAGLNAVGLLGESVLPPGSRMLMFLPLAHVFARDLAFICVIAGATTAFTPDTTTLLDDMQSFKPSLLLAVPRVFEKVYNGAEQKAIGDGKGKIFAQAAKVAIQYSTGISEGRIPLSVKAQHAVFDRLVYKKLRALMGGELTWAVSGGAPLGERLAHFFRGVGVTILEGYGLTETTAPVGVNTPWNVKVGTVGPPFPGSSVKLSDKGELLVKGVMVFKGYHNNPEATEQAMEDGWFNTGDIATIDHDGYITITGRSKELIVTAGGKNVSPAQLEDRIRANPLVSQCIVIGDQKPFVSAIITLDPDMLPTWAKNNGLAGITLAEAITNEKVLAEVQSAVDHANTSVSRAESIRKFEIIDSDFTEDNGYLTPSLKLKRNVVVQDFAPVIEKIYSGHKAS